MDNAFNSLDSPLKVNQVVCLEHQGNNLYGEVIQLIPERQLCWFRPLCLVVSGETASQLKLEGIKRSPESCQEQQDDSLILSQSFAEYSTRELIDLQSGSDLLWPESLFRPALDTEIIDFLPQLKDISHYSPIKTSTQKYLNKFVHLVWQAHQDKF